MRIAGLVLLLLVGGLCFARAGGATDLVVNDLEGVPRHPLDSAGKLASVWFFIWHDCPVSNGYAPEINRICVQYTNFVFYIVQVDPDLSPVAASKHAKEYALRAPVLLDSSHRLVKVAKATVTPEVVVFKPDSQILYRGTIDNLYAGPGKRRTIVTQHPLREALEAITTGQPVPHRKTKAVGCIIQPLADTTAYEHASNP